jgi:hypothetical protein
VILKDYGDNVPHVDIKAGIYKPVSGTIKGFQSIACGMREITTKGD